MDDEPPPLRIAIVGPCTSGKSTQAKLLRDQGYEVRTPAQEHSYVPYMWQRLTNPDILIYLDVNYDQVAQRRPRNPGTPERLAEQHERLAHAREHCDLYVDTSDLMPDEVNGRVLGFLQNNI